MNSALFSRVNLSLWAGLLTVTLAGYILIPASSQLPIHWGPTGEPDAFWPRNPALFLPVGLGIGVSLLFWAVGVFGSGSQLEASRHAWRTVVPALTAILLTIQIGVALIGLGYPDLMVRMICAAVGIVLILLGNILPKVQLNSLAGIRLPWLNDHTIWQKTQRLGGLLFMVGGSVLLASALVGAQPMSLLALLLLALLIPIGVTTFYSYQLAHRGR